MILNHNLFARSVFGSPLTRQCLSQPSQSNPSDDHTASTAGPPPVMLRVDTTSAVSSSFLERCNPRGSWFALQASPPRSFSMLPVPQHPWPTLLAAGLSKTALVLQPIRSRCLVWESIGTPPGPERLWPRRSALAADICRAIAKASRHAPHVLHEPEDLTPLPGPTVLTLLAWPELHRWVDAWVRALVQLGPDNRQFWTAGVVLTPVPTVDSQLLGCWIPSPHHCVSLHTVSLHRLQQLGTLAFTLPLSADRCLGPAEPARSPVLSCLTANAKPSLIHSWGERTASLIDSAVHRVGPLQDRLPAWCLGPVREAPVPAPISPCPPVVVVEDLATSLRYCSSGTSLRILVSTLSPGHGIACCPRVCFLGLTVGRWPVALVRRLEALADVVARSVIPPRGVEPWLGTTGPALIGATLRHCVRCIPCTPLLGRAVPSCLAVGAYLEHASETGRARARQLIAVPQERFDEKITAGAHPLEGSIPFRIQLRTSEIQDRSRTVLEHHYVPPSRPERP